MTWEIIKNTKNLKQNLTYNLVFDIQIFLMYYTIRRMRKKLHKMLT